MKDIFKIPLYFAEVFTSGKSFQNNPIIGSPFLNRCGLHVVRLMLSHSIMRVRMFILSRGITAEDRKQYFEQGYLLKENYLSDDKFQAVQREARDFTGEVREARQGNTITERAVLSPDVLENYPGIRSVLLGASFQKIIRFTSGHFRDPFYYLENIKNQYRKGKGDPQKRFHHDTFHPSMKCWLFIDDVEENSGAFVFIPQSHKLNWKRIKWEYQMSITARNSKSNIHARGSSRYTQVDIKALGLSEPHTFNVKKNTLVLVNVFGIHRRGDSTEKSTRLALWGDSRTNPFIPFPGIGGSFVNQMQYYFLDMYRKNVDESSAKKGKRSPWAIIPTDKK